MKFALNVVALVMISVSPWTPPAHPLNTRKNPGELLLSVTANDEIWAKYLNVGIKLKPKTLSAAARNVLAGLKALKDCPAVVGKQQPEQVAESSADGHRRCHVDVVVTRALNIVTDVSSYYDKQSAAVEFALDVMVSAIKCNALKYVLMQLYAIEKTNELQNEAVASQPPRVWNTMVHILDKVNVLKESIEIEFDMYQHWEVIANQDMTKKLSPQFQDFKSLVMMTLDASCELNTFDEILQNMEFDSNTENFDTATGAIQIFNKCQDSLMKIFNDIPISSMKLEVWESILNKPKFKEPSEHTTPVITQLHE